jgi:hypothetical protein
MDSTSKSIRFGGYGYDENHAGPTQPNMDRYYEEYSQYDGRHGETGNKFEEKPSKEFHPRLLQIDTQASPSPTARIGEEPTTSAHWNNNKERWDQNICGGGEEAMAAYRDYDDSRLNEYSQYLYGNDDGRNPAPGPAPLPHVVEASSSRQFYVGEEPEPFPTADSYGIHHPYGGLPPSADYPHFQPGIHPRRPNHRQIPRTTSPRHTQDSRSSNSSTTVVPSSQFPTRQSYLDSESDGFTSTGTIVPVKVSHWERTKHIGEGEIRRDSQSEHDSGGTPTKRQALHSTQSPRPSGYDVQLIQAGRRYDSRPTFDEILLEDQSMGIIDAPPESIDDWRRDHQRQGGDGKTGSLDDPYNQGPQIVEDDEFPLSYNSRPMLTTHAHGGRQFTRKLVSPFIKHRQFS